VFIFVDVCSFPPTREAAVSPESASPSPPCIGFPNVYCRFKGWLQYFSSQCVGRRCHQSWRRPPSSLILRPPPSTRRHASNVRGYGITRVGAPLLDFESLTSNVWGGGITGVGLFCRNLFCWLLFRDFPLGGTTAHLYVDRFFWLAVWV
jgi:hypothetical protein